MVKSNSTSLPRLSELFLVVCSLLYIGIAPYTKVEESFTLHATRDFLEYGLEKARWSKFDHVEFPGAVPRSFVPPALLSSLVYPLLALGSTFNLWTDGLRVQVLVRAVLALVNTSSIIFFTRRIRKAFGPTVARYTILLTVTQFHLMFWISRTLPNMLAFPFVQVALGFLVFPAAKRIRNGEGASVEIVGAFGLLAFTAVVMRLELVALIVPLALDVVLRGDASVWEVGTVTLVVSGASQALSVAVDSMFWGKTIWPEGSAIFFNVIQGKSSNWGTQPFHYYFTNFLPKIFNIGYPVAFFSMMIDRRTRRVGFPLIGFVGLLSLLGHKEWRFFVYGIPSFNVCIAASVRSIQVLFSKRMKRIILFSVISMNLVLTGMALIASVNNYPGGEAMTFLRNHFSSLNTTDEYKVHVDAHSAMTGASRFLHSFENPSPWWITPVQSQATQTPKITYSKQEDLTSFKGFDYLLTSSRDLAHMQEKWRILKSFQEFEKYQVRMSWPFVKPLFVENVWVVQSRN